jgi:hypothetical protein
VLHGRDEVAEQHLGRRGLDAVWAPIRVLESRREKLMLSRFDERVGVGVFAAPLGIHVRIQS